MKKLKSCFWADRDSRLGHPYLIWISESRTWAVFLVYSTYYTRFQDKGFREVSLGIVSDGFDCRAWQKSKTLWYHLRECRCFKERRFADTSCQSAKLKIFSLGASSPSKVVGIWGVPQEQYLFLLHPSDSGCQGRHWQRRQEQETGEPNGLSLSPGCGKGCNSL